MMMKKQLLSVTLGLGLITFGVQAQEKMDHSKTDHGKIDQAEMTTSYDAPNEFQNQLTKVYEASLDLKEAFVASDTTQIGKAVSPVQDALFAVGMKLLDDKAHTAWMDQLKTLKSSLTEIDRARTIASQREHFANFSQALYQSVKSFGTAGETAYYQYCPMANDNQGAYWLSDNKKIRNPYFGDKMLTCGSTKETINK